MLFIIYKADPRLSPKMSQYMSKFTYYQFENILVRVEHKTCDLISRMDRIMWQFLERASHQQTFPGSFVQLFSYLGQPHKRELEGGYSYSKHILSICLFHCGVHIKRSKLYQPKKLSQSLLMSASSRVCFLQLKSGAIVMLQFNYVKGSAVTHLHFQSRGNSKLGGQAFRYQF